MSEQVIHELTRLVGGDLPADYLRTLRNYPAVLLNVARALDDSDSEGFVDQVDLIRDFSCLLEINREARTDSVPDPEGIEHIWPDQLLVIGETGAGDYYCLDIDETQPCIMQFDHQSVVFEVVADDIQEFIELLVEVYVEYDPEDDEIDPDEELFPIE